MISFSIQKNDLSVQSITVKGHANQNEFGKDIVCACVSTALFMTVNQLEKLSKLELVSYHIEEGYFDIAIKQFDKIVNAVLENLEYTLNELKLEYPKYINKL